MAFLTSTNAIVQDAPLMKKSSIKENTITFEWIEPSKTSTYTLHIYRGKSNKPLKSLPFKGGKLTVKIKKGSQPVSWRASSTDEMEHESKNTKRFVIANSTDPDAKPVSKEVSAPPGKTRYILRESYFSTASDYEQKAEDTDLSGSNEKINLSGSTIFLKGEAWKGKYGVTLSLRQQALSSGKVEFVESECIGELGYQWRQTPGSSHKFFAGFLYGSTNFELESADGDYNRAFLSLRHQYENFLGSTFSIELNTSILQAAQTDLTPPPFRILPWINWYFKKNLWLSFMAGDEMNRADLNYKEGGSNGNIDVSSNVTTLGVALNWGNF